MWTVTVVDDEIATYAAIDADSPIGRLTLSAARFEVCRRSVRVGGTPFNVATFCHGCVNQPAARDLRRGVKTLDAVIPHVVPQRGSSPGGCCGTRGDVRPGCRRCLRSRFRMRYNRYRKHWI